MFVKKSSLKERMVFVVIKIITQELEIESNLKQRLEFICEFCHIKPTIINGSIRKIDKTNLSYIEPHKIIVKDMGNYIEMQKELSKNKERLEITNKKSLELDNNSNKVKDIVNNLKTTFTNKDKYVLTKDDKDKIDKFIQQVDSTNKEYKKMQKLSITLNNVETE